MYQFGKHVYVNMRENSNKLVRMVPLLICCVKKLLLPNEIYEFAYFRTILLPYWRNIIALLVILMQNYQK
jgi:hypothetical protein